MALQMTIMYYVFENVVCLTLLGGKTEWLQLEKDVQPHVYGH